MVDSTIETGSLNVFILYLFECLRYARWSRSARLAANSAEQQVYGVPGEQGRARTTAFKAYLPRITYVCSLFDRDDFLDEVRSECFARFELLPFGMTFCLLLLML